MFFCIKVLILESFYVFAEGLLENSTNNLAEKGIILRKSRILASIKDKGQRTRDGGAEDGKQRSKGHEQ
jgi:hypothetical protein